jgi:hypothetical protein
MTTKTAKTITATAEGYTITLTDDRISISRESGEWAGDGRWQDGRIVDCPARLGDTDEESELTYWALEDALEDALETDGQPTYHGTRLAALPDGCYDLFGHNSGGCDAAGCAGYELRLGTIAEEDIYSDEHGAEMVELADGETASVPARPAPAE